MTPYMAQLWLTELLNENDETLDANTFNEIVSQLSVDKPADGDMRCTND